MLFHHQSFLFFMERELSNNIKTFSKKMEKGVLAACRN